MSDYKLVLEHHGILGQKWGVRRFQNADGTRTAAGQKRYSANGVRSYKAKRENAKVDKSFKKWKSGSDDRENAINVGKRANENV